MSAVSHIFLDSAGRTANFWCSRSRGAPVFVGHFARCFLKILETCIRHTTFTGPKMDESLGDPTWSLPPKKHSHCHQASTPPPHSYRQMPGVWYLYFLKRYCMSMDGTVRLRGREGQRAQHRQNVGPPSTVHRVCGRGGPPAVHLVRGREAQGDTAFLCALSCVSRSGRKFSPRGTSVSCTHHASYNGAWGPDRRL